MIQRWERSGEEFFVEEIRCAWLESVRPAAEILIGTLLREHTQLLAPVLAQEFNKALASTYCACCVCARVCMCSRCVRACCGVCLYEESRV